MFLALVAFLLPGKVLFGQILPSDLAYPANHLKWFTISGEYFDIHFQEGNEETALAASVIADEIYEPVTTLYQHYPKQKTSIVLRDRDDYSNGAAYFYDNKIEIFVPAIDIKLRGTHNWLKNVITHEFIHIVQIGTAKQSGPGIPAVYLQWLSYEDVRRPDILYGFPNGIITFPFSNISIPAWFAEGTAQYQRQHLHFDFWDTHRDMLLRTRIEANTYLSLNEMGNFSSKNSLERELIYNQGFALVNYLANRFGETVLAELTKKSASGKNNFNSVLESVTGISVHTLFNDWILHEKENYREKFGHLQLQETIPVEPSGFYNFHPTMSPDGSALAYLTNRGFDHSQTRLVMYDENGRLFELDVEQPSAPQAQSNPSYHPNNNRLQRISSKFSFSPDSKRIAFSRADKNKFGEHYNDVFIYDIETEKETKITKNKRIFDVAWHPSENLLAGVIIEDGRQNMVTVHTDNGAVQTLSDFPFGTNVYTPVWSHTEEAIIFSASNQGNRNLFKMDINGNTEPLFTDDQVDFRDPAIDPSTGHLYFSADFDGIFNVYRYKKNESDLEKITSVAGGAFMPFFQNNALYFADYHADGYKISKIDIHENSVFPVQAITSPSFNPLNIVDFELISSEISDQTKSEKTFTFTYKLSENGPKPGATVYERTIAAYSEKATPLNIYPVVRFDNYTKLRGSNSRLLKQGKFADAGENLWRDMKVGAYLSSRDVTESLSVFGGLLLGVGSNPEPGIGAFFKPSRLLDADRDLFFTIDYNGLPFIKRSWSPTISFEFYNMVRNVSNGLQVEEFPCTSCLPETQNVDIRYMVWEAGLFLRSKLNRWSLLETGINYSPYRVKIDGFFSNEYNEFIPGSSSEYYRGVSLTAAHTIDFTLPYIHADIAPKGLRAEFRYRYEPGKLLRNFEVENGALRPAYETEKNHSLELKSRFGVALGQASAMQFTSRVFAFLNNPEDYFYQDYSGGLSGLRSYPFFAIGGQRTFFVRTSFLTPLLTDIHKQAGPLLLDKIYAHFYAETGNGYGGPLANSSQLKNGIGAELRFSLNSYYLFPLKFFINTSYGFNQFDITLPADFIITDGRNTVSYGQELLFYFGLTFDFDFL